MSVPWMHASTGGHAGKPHRKQQREENRPFEMLSQRHYPLHQTDFPSSISHSLLAISQSEKQANTASQQYVTKYMSRAAALAARTNHASPFISATSERKLPNEVSPTTILARHGTHPHSPHFGLCTTVCRDFVLGGGRGNCQFQVGRNGCSRKTRGDVKLTTSSPRCTGVWDVWVRVGAIHRRQAQGF